MRITAIIILGLCVSMAFAGEFVPIPFWLAVAACFELRYRKLNPRALTTDARERRTRHVARHGGAHRAPSTQPYRVVKRDPGA